jgi:hypothetical protein
LRRTNADLIKIKKFKSSRRKAAFLFEALSNQQSQSKATTAAPEPRSEIHHRKKSIEETNER